VRISPEALAAEAEATGFRPDVLETAVQLLSLLSVLTRHPALRGKLALKGGTALNLFVFDAPRLSVDIDLNYVGAQQLSDMQNERPVIEAAVESAFRREDFVVGRTRSGHAGGGWSLRYPSAGGQYGRLEVDINFMYRLPLWPVTSRDSIKLGRWRATRIPIVDLHELAAGKFAALLARGRARDLFDSRLIFSLDGLDRQRLRLAFVVYGAMNRRDWRKVSAADVSFDAAELMRQLKPTLNREGLPSYADPKEYGTTLVDECRSGLSSLLPLNAAELEFLDRLLDQGKIDSSLLTADAAFQRRIRDQPSLLWKAQNVRRFRGLS